jgi:hypothetical protein
LKHRYQLTRVMEDPACDASGFWARFQEVCTAGPDLLSLLCDQLSRDEWHALHGVNHAMRRSMNATVTRVTCGEEPFPTQDLLVEFPNANALHLQLSSVAALMHQMARCNASLLGRLHHLRIEVCPDNDVGALIQPMLAMLSR